jgi:hypothetical protein
LNSTDKLRTAQSLGINNLSKLSDKQWENLVTRIRPIKSASKEGILNIILKYKRILTPYKVFLLFLYSTDITKVSEELGTHVNLLTRPLILKIVKHYQFSSKIKDIIVAIGKENILKLKQSEINKLDDLIQQIDSGEKTKSPDVSKTSATQSTSNPTQSSANIQDTRKMYDILKQSDDKLKTIKQLGAENVRKTISELDIFVIAMHSKLKGDTQSVIDILNFVLSDRNNLNSFRVGQILYFAPDLDDAARVLGQENIDKLDAHSIYHLLDHVHSDTDKMLQLIDIIGRHNLQKLNQSQIDKLIAASGNNSEITSKLEFGHAHFSNLNKSEIYSELEKSNDKLKTAKELGTHNINKLNDVDLFRLTNSTNKDQMVDLILKYKGSNLSSNNVYTLLKYAEHKSDIVHRIGIFSVNKLDKKFIIQLINDSENKFDIINALGKFNLDKLNQEEFIKVLFTKPGVLKTTIAALANYLKSKDEQFKYIFLYEIFKYATNNFVHKNQTNQINRTELLNLYNSILDAVKPYFEKEIISRALESIKRYAKYV